MGHDDYEHMLFYFAYQTFIKTADDFIKQHQLNRQHHRFLFFICQKPGSTVSELLTILEISKQGSHKTLKTLKEKQLIYEESADFDRRHKQLFPTDKGLELIAILNQAQKALLKNAIQKEGDKWTAVMEELARPRAGYYLAEALKKDR
ncbi:MAG: MarR family transcriptional regulator [Streptococcus pyogenes]|nr:MAG: MarR family transcriptional regulator [Streptococcus pyogenes]